MKKLVLIITLLSSISVFSQTTRKLTIDKSAEGFTLFCKAKLMGLNNIKKVDGIKTTFGKDIAVWEFDTITDQIIIPPKEFGGFSGFYQIKIDIGGASISQQIYSEGRNFLIQEDKSFPDFDKIKTVKVCGGEITRYERWKSNGIIINDFDITTYCKEPVTNIEITFE